MKAQEAAWTALLQTVDPCSRSPDNLSTQWGKLGGIGS